jgi:hypothetical protein
MILLNVIFQTEQNMRFLILFFIITNILSIPGICQTKAKITDVDFALEGRYIVIYYNIEGSLPKEQMTIDLKFINENSETIIPNSITGDAGTKLFGDGPKTILWDIVADQVTLSGNLKALVTISSSEILFRGPSNALLSVFVPGLGSYFVDKRKGRAALTTLSTLGLVTYGIAQKIKAEDLYSDYNASLISSQIERLYTEANNANHNYYIATRAGACIWALDIIWVIFKGIHNKKEAKSAYDTFTFNGFDLNFDYNRLQLGYSITF